MSLTDEHFDITLNHLLIVCKELGVDEDTISDISQVFNS